MVARLSSFRPEVRVFVRQLILLARIGARHDERGREQPLIIDIEADVSPPRSDTIKTAVDYVMLADAARSIAFGDHIVLVETFAERLAEACMAIPGVRGADITVIKPEPLAPALVGVRLAKGTLDDRPHH